MVVIGGGAAGLAAAARLCGRREVVLVEARDRLGGRIDTRVDRELGIPLEHGAEFVHGRPAATLALARRAGARVLEIPERHLRRSAGRSVDVTAELGRAEALLGTGTRDDEPFAAVLRRARRAGRSSRELALAAQFVRGFYLADPATASSLALARLTRGLEEIEGDVIARLDRGYARLLAPLRRTLARAGAAVRLSTRVEEVRWGPGHVEVRATGPAGGRLPVLRGAAAVITLPAGVLAADAVRFLPALPDKRRAAAGLPMGPLVKVLLRFRRAPWGERRAPVFLHVAGAAVPVFWTLAPLRAPVLVGWAGGPDAARLSARPPQEVVRGALRAAARGLGRAPGALEALLDGAAVEDWSRDPLARGGYAVFPVGSAGAATALAQPVAGTLFFAGEATDRALAGTVEGALRSGERAAREVLARR